MLRDDQICATITCQYSGGVEGAERHRTVIPGDTRMLFTRVKVLYGWAPEIGTICQIGGSTGKPCIFLVQKGSFSAISHYVVNDVAQALYLTASLFCSAKITENGPFLGPKRCAFLLEKRQFDKWHPFHACTPPPLKKCPMLEQLAIAIATAWSTQVLSSADICDASERRQPGALTTHTTVTSKIVRGKKVTQSPKPRKVKVTKN